MYHDEAACAAQFAVVRIRVTDIEGKMELAAGIHAVRIDPVESFWRLFIALSRLGAELSAHAEYVVDLEKMPAFICFLYPQLQLPVFLDDADEDGFPEMLSKLSLNIVAGIQNAVILSLCRSCCHYDNRENNESK